MSKTIWKKELTNMTNRYETAFGEALYPHLSKPDYKFRPEGLYHTELLVDEKEAQKDIDVINKSIELKLQEFKKENPGKKPLMAPKPYKTHQEDPTIPEGKIKFNFKMKASGINSKTKEPFEQKPNLYDFKLDPIPTEKNIWSESVIRVQYEPFGYYVASTGLGCTLRLKGVQVKTLVEGQTQDIGFTKVEPGENRVATEEANY